MKIQLFLIPLLCLTLARAENDISALETGVEREDDTTSAMESEAHGIIPEGVVAVSTPPLTPISVVLEKKPYEQALEELALAQELWKKGKAEAASDVALQAYDDLMGIHVPKKKTQQRQKLRLERRQAATLYIDASVAYIQEYINMKGSTPAAIKEGRARLGDLWDVAVNYPELQKKLRRTLDAYDTTLSSSTR